jgi:hypothetical protein
VKPADFDAFLSIFYPPYVYLGRRRPHFGLDISFRNFNTLQERSFDEWSSILDLSTRWGFTSIRDMAIRCLKAPSAHHLLLLARKYSVDQWVLIALSGLCERPQPLSVDEARLMDFKDIVLVGSVRESIRSHKLSVKLEEILDCIQAWEKGEPWSPAEKVPEKVPDPPVKNVRAIRRFGVSEYAHLNVYTTNM